MSIDYLEFKKYLEHSSYYSGGSGLTARYFSQKDQADYYKEKSKHQVWQAHDDLSVAGYVNILKNRIAEYKKKKKKMKDMKEGQSRSNLEKECKDLYESIQLMQAQVIEWVGPDRAKNYNIPKVSAISHSNLEHASKAGMPTTIKKDQQAQIRKEIIKRIDAYENSAKFGKIRSDGSALGGKFSASNNTNMRGGGYTAKSEMRRASGKGEAADYKSRDDAYNALMSYISKVTGSAAYSGTFSKEEMELIFTLRKIHPGTANDVASKLKDSLLSHDNLEHASIAGAPSRLRTKMQSAIYKKTGYQSKGSYAGAPNTAKQATTDQNKAVANARFSANIKSAIEACNRDAAEAQSVYVEATTRINNIVSRNRGEVNSIIRSVNEYNENVRKVRSQTITKKNVTFGTVANGKLYQGVHDVEVPVDANRQFISFSAGAQKISANKYVYKPKMLLIDSDPGTYKEV